MYSGLYIILPLALVGMVAFGHIIKKALNELRAYDKDRKYFGFFFKSTPATYFSKFATNKSFFGSFYHKFIINDIRIDNVIKILVTIELNESYIPIDYFCIKNLIFS